MDQVTKLINSAGKSSNPKAELEAAQALVRLFHRLTTDGNFLQTSAARIRQNSDGHQAVYNQATQRLATSGSALKNSCMGYPLALLQALDDYLADSFAHDTNAPETRIKIDIDNSQHGYILHRHNQQRLSHHQRHFGQIQKWLRRHWVIAESPFGYPLTIRKATHDAHTRLNNNKKLRIHIGSFSGDTHPAWLKQYAPHYRAYDVTNPTERWDAIEQHLINAAKAKADILILPELTVPLSLRERVADWLANNSTSLCFVLPGSFHQAVGSETYNHCQLLDNDGITTLCHNKLTSAGTPDASEEITPGSTIELLDTPIGLIATPICLDFGQEGRPFSDLWQQIAADWMLVPAMDKSKTLNNFLTPAASLNRAHGSVTIVANQPPDRHPDAKLGFAYAPPATRTIARDGDEHPETIVLSHEEIVVIAIDNRQE